MSFWTLRVPQDWPRYAGVDLAASLGQQASWTVMMTVAVDLETQRRYPLEIVRKRQSFPDTIQMILQQWRKHGHRLIYVENNGFQQAVLQHLPTQDRSLPLVGFHTGSQKHDEQVGIPSLSASMANGSWLLPERGEAYAYDCECGWCGWRQELELHPHSRYQDCLMAMWFCESAARGSAADAFARSFRIYF